MNLFFGGSVTVQGLVGSKLQLSVQMREVVPARKDHKGTSKEGSLTQFNCTQRVIRIGHRTVLQL